MPFHNVGQTVNWYLGAWEIMCKIRNYILVLVLAGCVSCVGAGPHLTISVTEPQDIDGPGLPGLPPFPEEARPPDTSGVAKSSRFTGVVTSDPIGFQGVINSDENRADDPFLEHSIKAVQDDVEAQ